MPRRRENPRVAELVAAMERPNLDGYAPDELMQDLINTEAQRVTLVVRAGLVVDALTRHGISHRTMEDKTGIPKSTLNQWQKQVAA